MFTHIMFIKHVYTHYNVQGIVQVYLNIFLIVGDLDQFLKLVKMFSRASKYFTCTFHVSLGECPCVATEPYNNTITKE
jgi:hypothetical protein